MAIKDFSQYGEQVYIENYFAGCPAGPLLDVGSAGGEIFSNSRNLLLKGWSGILIDPSPQNSKAVTELYADYPKVKCLEVALTPDYDGDITFYESYRDSLHNLPAQLLGTTSLKQTNKWNPNLVNYREIKVQAISVKTLLKLYPTDFKFVNIDVEGENYKLLLSLPLDLMNTSLLCVEHDDNANFCMDYCMKMGLTKVIAKNKVNLIMGK